MGFFNPIDKRYSIDLLANVNIKMENFIQIKAFGELQSSLFLRISLHGQNSEPFFHTLDKRVASGPAGLSLPVQKLRPMRELREGRLGRLGPSVLSQLHLGNRFFLVVGTG